MRGVVKNSHKLYIGATVARTGNALHRYLMPTGSKKENKEVRMRWEEEIEKYLT